MNRYKAASIVHALRFVLCAPLPNPVSLNSLCSSVQAKPDLAFRLHVTLAASSRT